MARIDDVANTIKTALISALNSAAIPAPGETIYGWPNEGEMLSFIQAGKFMVSVFPQPHTKNSTRFPPSRRRVVTPLSVPLVATVSGGNTITLSGSVVAGLNVHTFVGAPLKDAYYQTVGGDTLTSVATAIKNAINALSLAGISASSSGAVVTVTGSPVLKCNPVGSQVSIQREVARVARDVQVTVWAPSHPIRSAAADAIISSVGTAVTQKLPLPDLSNLWIRYKGDVLVDPRQTDNPPFRHDIMFDCEYGINRTSLAYQIGSTSLTITPQTAIGGSVGSPITIISGGP